MSVALPSKGPNADQYEDFVSAALTALGFYLERRLTLKDGGTEILELDAVATPSGAQYEQRILIDAKSGSWGIGDIFKLFGWRMYLGISQGVLAYKDPIDAIKSSVCSGIGKATSISPQHVAPNVASVVNILPEQIALQGQDREALLATAWYSYIAERVCQAAFVAKTKEKPQSPGIASARDYSIALQQALIEKDPEIRINSLYSAWTKCPRLIEACAPTTQPPFELQSGYENSHDFLWLQYAGMLEHRARVSIIKNAVDLITSGKNVKIGPPSFQSGVNALTTIADPYRVPYALQVFIEVFGGFMLTSTAPESDAAFLSRLVGVATADLPATIALLDVFFPTGHSWQFSQKGEIRRTLLIPCLWLGVGCFLRAIRFPGESHSVRYPQMGWLLARWHNALVALLEEKGKLKAPEAAAAD